MSSINPFPQGTWANAGTGSAAQATVQLEALGLMNNQGSIDAVQGDPAGRLPLAQDDNVRAMLIEMRVLNQVIIELLTSKTLPDVDLETKRNDELSILSPDLG